MPASPFDTVAVASIRRPDYGPLSTDGGRNYRSGEPPFDAGFAPLEHSRRLEVAPVTRTRERIRRGVVTLIQWGLFSDSEQEVGGTQKLRTR